MKSAKLCIPVFILFTLCLILLGCVYEPLGSTDIEPSESSIQTVDDSVVDSTEPLIPIVNTSCVIIAERTYEHEGRVMPSGKMFIPLEFDGAPQLHEIKNNLPVITFYQFDMTTLQGDGWNESYFEEMNTPRYGVVFRETPDSVLYTLFDEDFNVVSTTDIFEFPTEIGDYIMRIDVFDSAFYVRIVIGEPRGWCDRIDRYHGGREGLKVYDFNKILEMRELLDKDDQAVADYFNSICDIEDGRRWECPCFIQTRADLLSFFSWIRFDQLQLPFSHTAALESFLLRDGYADIYVRYIIDDMRFTFVYPSIIMSPFNESNEGTSDNGIAQGSFQRLATVGDAYIYFCRNVYRVENPDFSEQPEYQEPPDVSFMLNVNGMPVTVIVSIDCVNPDTCEDGWDFGDGHSCHGEWVDRQTAFDGLLQFEFITLF